MGRIKFWARSRSGAETNSESHAPKQPLSQHLQGVANLAIELARLARPGDHQFSRDAELAGLMHDLGKYSEAFQKMLETGAGECQHAIHGAILTAGKEKPLYPHIALAIAGHHTGIPDHSGNKYRWFRSFRIDDFRLKRKCNWALRRPIVKGFDKHSIKSQNSAALRTIFRRQSAISISVCFSAVWWMPTVWMQRANRQIKSP